MRQSHLSRRRVPLTSLLSNMKPRDRRSVSSSPVCLRNHPYRRWHLCQSIIFLVITYSLIMCTGAQVSFGMRKLAYSTNQFGLDLMRAMDRSDDNMAFCPFCISSSLSMMLSSAHGSTSSALRHALYLWGMQTNEINVAFYDLMTHLGVNRPHDRSFRRLGFFPNIESPQSVIPSLASGPTNNASNPENEMSFVTNVYVQRDFPIDYHYHMLLQRFYKTAIHPLDFHFNGEETRQHINAIVEKETNGKISDILPERQSPASQLLLLSALYFRGTLDLKMRVSGATRRHPAAPPGAPLMVLTRPSSLVFGDDHLMLESRSAKIRYRFDRYLNSTAIEMPFKGGLITLVLLMPEDPNGLEMMLTRLSAQVLVDVINSLEVKRVNIMMPELSVKRGNSNLTWALSHLGLADLFRPGFAQLYDISDYKWLSVSGIVHKTRLDIRESGEGTSGWQAPQRPVPHPPVSSNIVKNQVHSPLIPLKPNTSPFVKPGQDSNIIDVKIDKPFIYFVFDNVSGLVIAMGKFGREPVNYRLPI